MLISHNSRAFYNRLTVEQAIACYGSKAINLFQLGKSLSQTNQHRFFADLHKKKTKKNLPYICSNKKFKNKEKISKLIK
ncbi:hypothetical protein BpHYR1_008133 [Brachionus plicatilis]|uniref:Uncharacterized protein n=1 Tax=Brachionus plicatilis TaxID=10195 RepID=A0A3M7S2J6_BRAPC|nr:hypothetical protein BpHYR1_008133 [Brachionus plicatilis]